jgi:hypothetical protein
MKNAMARVCGMYWRQEKAIQDFGGETRGRDHMEDLCVVGMIILKLIFKKWDAGNGLD